MKTVNIHEAKTHLSRLIDSAVAGEPFVIARAGKPLVKVSVLAETPPKRTGFLQGVIDVPEDFDEIASDDIAAMFSGDAER